MSEAPDDLEKLVAEVRKTISENKQFLAKLIDDAEEDDADDENEETVIDEEFEEL